MKKRSNIRKMFLFGLVMTLVTGALVNVACAADNNDLESTPSGNEKDAIGKLEMITGKIGAVHIDPNTGFATSFEVCGEEYNININIENPSEGLTQILIDAMNNGNKVTVVFDDAHNLKGLTIWPIK